MTTIETNQLDQVTGAQAVPRANVAVARGPAARLPGVVPAVALPNVEVKRTQGSTSYTFSVDAFKNPDALIRSLMNSGLKAPL